MIGFIRRLLGFNQVDTTRDAVDHSPFFSGCACFSKLVPQAIVQKWVAFGGEVYTPRSPSKAIYFFATDMADKWVTTLTSRSVTVIHAVWIMHCIEHGFQVPIAEYVLDGITIPLKLFHGLAAPNSGADHVADARLLSREALHDQPNESLHPSLVQLDILTTPPNILRKRKREPAYFDSPTRSFVFSEFDKDGVPQRPRKQRRLRLSPSFTEREKENMALKAWSGTSNDDMSFMSDANATVEGWTVENVGIADSPNQLSLYAEGLQGPFVATKGSQDRLLDPFQITAKHLRTIDFTRSLPTRRRFQFPDSTQLQPRDCNLNSSTVKLSDRVGVASGDTADTKPTKKITFASHASVRLYRARSDTEVLQDDLKPNINTAQEPTNELHDEQYQEALKAPALTNEGPLTVQGETEEATCPKVSSGEPTLVHERNAVNVGDAHSHISALFAGATDTSANSITLEITQMLDYRTNLLKSHPSDSWLGNGKLATLFEVGQSCQGMEFRHE